MKKSVEELKAMSPEDLSTYFKQILLEEYNITKEQYEKIETFLDDLSKRQDIESLLDVVDIIKEENFNMEEVILCLASKVSEVNFFRNKLVEAEQIIKMIQIRESLEKAMTDKDEAGPFPDSISDPNFKE